MGISTFPAASAGGATTLPAVGGSIFFAPTTLATRDFGFIEFDFGTPLAAGKYEFTFTGMTYVVGATNTFIALGTDGTTVLATQTGTSIIGKLTSDAPIQKIAFKNAGNAFGFTNASTSGMTVTPGIKVVTKGTPWAASSTAVAMTNFPASDAFWQYKTGYYDRTTNTAFHMAGTAVQAAQMYTGVPNLTTGDIVWTARATRTGLNGTADAPHYGSNMGGVEGGGGVFWNQGQYYSGGWTSASDWWFYSTSSNTWSSRSGTTFKGQEVMVQIASDKIMAIGGYNYDGSYRAQSAIYNTSTDTWSNVVNMPSGLYGGLALTQGGPTAATQVVVFGNGYQNESSGGITTGPMYYTISNNTWNAGNAGNTGWPGGIRFYITASSSMQAAYDGTSFWFFSEGALYKVAKTSVFVAGGSTGYAPVGVDSTAGMYDYTCFILGTNIITGFNDLNARKYSTALTFPSYLS